MQFFSVLSLKYKILSIALIGALGFISYLAFNYQANQNNTVRLDKIQSVNFPVLDLTGQIWLSLFEARNAMQTALEQKRLDRLAEIQKVAGKVLLGCLMAPCAMFVVWQMVEAVI